MGGGSVPSPMTPRVNKVYPRVGGGSVPAAAACGRGRGLSPRVRGKRRAVNHPGVRVRSIPACAGEAERHQRHQRVYPRVCGGSGTPQAHGAQRLGLSPRVRGKRTRPLSGCPQCRSIPACAGEASRLHSRHRLLSVYPRVCGGSTEFADGNISVEGLSPRVRGKPLSTASPGRLNGSIPACAREAPASLLAAESRSVYPRVCGGSAVGIGLADVGRGLSLRVRGKLAGHCATPRYGRSIPACAGEADARRGAGGRRAVYPRVCGGSLLRGRLP